MKLRLTLDETVKPNLVTAAMSYDGSPWNDIAVCEEPKFNEKLNKKLLYSSASALPPAIRYLSPDHSIVLFERPPQYVTFQFTQAMQNNIATDAPAQVVLRLPIPWQRYVLLLGQNNKIANLFLFFAKDQIRSLTNDEMCIAPILNFYGKGRLCPASYANIPQYDHTIPGAIDAAMDLVWHSGFNLDTVLAIKTLMDNTRTPLGRFANNYEQMYRWWSHQTFEEVMSWNFTPVYKSFMQLATSADLRHDYAGKTDDMVVNFALAAQSARG